MKEKVKLSEKYADFLYRIIPFKDSQKKCKRVCSLILFWYDYFEFILFNIAPALIAYYIYLNRDLSGEKMCGVFLMLSASGNLLGMISHFTGEVKEILEVRLNIRPQNNQDE